MNDLEQENARLKQVVADLYADLAASERDFAQHLLETAAYAEMLAAVGAAEAAVAADPDISWLRRLEALCARGYEHRLEPVAAFSAELIDLGAASRTDNPQADLQDALQDLNLHTHGDVALLIRRAVLAGLLAGAHQQLGLARQHDAHGVLGTVAGLVDDFSLFGPS